MKKMIIWLFSALLLVSMVMPAAAEETDVEYRLSTVKIPEGGKIAAGEEFSVLLSLGAVDQLAMVEYHFRYDKTLMEPVNTTVEGFLSACLMKDVNPAPGRNDADSDTYGEVWVTGFSETDQVVADGEVISTVTFKALKDITEDTPMVGYYAGATNAAMEPYTCGMVNGGVVVGAKDTDDIPEEMLSPINNTVPSVGGGVAPTDDGDGVDGGMIALIVVGVLAVGGMIVLMVMAKKR